ncbi:hypothetical protein BGZ73_008184 [Actinomortierella ambigua]|nr:hypothetical protein BGZ73_008184 [Actinomortierella ambigua]
MFFFGSSMTPLEKEQAAALKTLIDARKGVLKQELKQMEQDIKKELAEAKKAYKQRECEIHMNALRSMAERVQQEIAEIQATEEYQNGDDKTKSCIDRVQSWLLWGLGKEAKKHEEKLHRCSSCHDTLVTIEADKEMEQIEKAPLNEKSASQTLVDVY